MSTTPGSSETLPLLLLAGTACDARVFAPVLALLDHPKPCVLVMENAATTADLVRRILADAPPRFDLAGFSLGGIAALEIAAQAQDRIGRLALLDTNCRPDPPANTDIRRIAVARARSHGMASYIDDNWANLVSPANRNDAPLRDTILAMAEACGPDRLADQQEIAIHRADSRPRLAAIHVPTLIIAGADEKIVPLEALAELRAGIAHAVFHLIAKAGHFAPLENPEATAFHMRAWLDRPTA